MGSELQLSLRRQVRAIGVQEERQDEGPHIGCEKTLADPLDALPRVLREGAHVEAPEIDTLQREKLGRAKDLLALKVEDR